jgi:hypothetical protein
MVGANKESPTSCWGGGGGGLVETERGKASALYRAN